MGAGGAGGGGGGIRRRRVAAALVGELELDEELAAAWATLDGHALVRKLHDRPVLDAPLGLEGQLVPVQQRQPQLELLARLRRVEHHLDQQVVPDALKVSMCSGMLNC